MKIKKIDLTFERETEIGSIKILEPITLLKVVGAARAKGCPINERNVVNYVSPDTLGVFVFEVRNAPIIELALWVVRP